MHKIVEEIRKMLKTRVSESRAEPIRVEDVRYDDVELLLRVTTREDHNFQVWDSVIFTSFRPSSFNSTYTVHSLMEGEPRIFFIYLPSDPRIEELWVVQIYWWRFTDLQSVYFGDPITMTKSSLPALAVQPISSDFSRRGSRYDQKTHTIEVRLIYDIEQYFSSEELQTIQVTGRKWYGDNRWKYTTEREHLLSVWQTIIFDWFIPSSHNWTYTVIEIEDDFNFVVSRTEVPDPDTFWTVTTAIVDKVFSIEDAILKVENSNANHWTERFTVSGAIQKNPFLPYVDAQGTQRNASEDLKVLSVNYSFSDTRGFPTFEVTTTVEAIAIGDR